MKTTLALLSGALMATAGAAQAQEVLNIYNWGNYTSPELIEKFTEETGIEVTITDYDSNDTALARIRQGGHGFDIVVPSNTYVQTFVEEGLIQPLDPEIVTDRGNISPQWQDVAFDPGREYTVPWAWGTTGLIVNSSVYDGDPNDAGLIFDPPEELAGGINVIPEMVDVMSIAVYYAGGEDRCTTDTELLRKVRDMLMEAKPDWLALDYGTIDAYAQGDLEAGIYWNGATMRARLENPDLVYGYPRTGYPVWMDNVAVLSDAQNPENAMQFVNFILQPENAALISEFARYANGVEGSAEFMDEEMRNAPEIVVPEDLVSAGRFSEPCSQDVTDIHTQIWTELLQ
ncbi:ABC transporter substrate-binding protein [Wenxinia marina]|uniref:Putrescine-binding periplasmic protein n=1 Tax=Wenxinia marina DSM 24838 TaxID=1123501 RepID=A0A0D0Q732_9RHOB|nr:extracellular solute-binding protein [Wenxinia marina]KIQ68252.1 Spermidine/putrescine-binding periplasmic protein [Wenxinia marina DSM 24838]GGL77112.1 putrescine-binding periplasmic protein [Wenxinia marina]